MHLSKSIVVSLAVLVATIATSSESQAACTLPYTLTNGQTADATQVMANLNALANCITNPGPAGSTNAMQYNAGGGNFGGVGPLTNGPAPDRFHRQPARAADADRRDWRHDHKWER
jgi:hypothetical protein